MKVLVTGASGFIGRHICEHLMSHGHEVGAIVRRSPRREFSSKVTIIAADLANGAIEKRLFDGCECVIHLAARAHVLKEDLINPLDEFRKINVDATRDLARVAGESGVKLFVYVSSIGVNGNKTFGEPFSEESVVNPHEPYAISKLEAESVLRLEAERAGMKYVIVRPPLVYGPDAPGNFGLLLRLLASGVPLPFGSIKSRRSLISIWNLVDFLRVCTEHPAAANELFLVSDGGDITLPEIFRYLGEGFGRKNFVFPCPSGLLSLLARLVGRSTAFDKLGAELLINGRKARHLLGWSPAHSLEEDMRRTGRDFRAILSSSKDL